VSYSQRVTTEPEDVCNLARGYDVETLALSSSAARIYDAAADHADAGKSLWSSFSSWVNALLWLEKRANIAEATTTIFGGNVIAEAQ
jgi:hypothetical protein